MNLQLHFDQETTGSHTYWITFDNEYWMTSVFKWYRINIYQFWLDIIQKNCKTVAGHALSSHQSLYHLIWIYLCKLSFILPLEKNKQTNKSKTYITWYECVYGNYTLPHHRRYTWQTRNHSIFFQSLLIHWNIFM